MKIIDLRSDTVTKPSILMRQSILNADVGDDVFGEDPSVNALEERAATLLGKEAALFVSSGTQGNLLSVLTHCQRGDEYIAGMTSHLYRWEAGGSCVLGGVYPHPIDFESDGSLDLTKVKNTIKPDDLHFAKTKLLALENTHNGKVLSLAYLRDAYQFAKDNHLSLHLDGARIFNAAIHLNKPVHEISKYFDSVTFCLSKGLGAPVGSLICSDRDFIAKARRLRKMVGGGMRQAGILASAGMYALKNNIARLAEDHDNASFLGEQLEQIDALRRKITVHTNMVFIQVGSLGQVELPQYCQEKGISILGGNTLRLVTHLDVSRDDIKKVINVFKDCFSNNNPVNLSKNMSFENNIYDISNNGNL